MSLRAEIPQCCVCYEPFKKNSRLVRPPGCGHVICKPCGDVMKNLTNKCPFHCPTPAGSAFESVFVDFGLHDIFSLADLGEGGNEYKATVSVDDLRSAEAETVVRLFSDMARSNPQAWITNSTSRNSKGLVFLRASRVLQKIGNGIEGSDHAKDLLNRLAIALAELKDLYDSMADMINKSALEQDDLKKANESVRADLSRSKNALQAKEVWFMEKLATRQSSHVEREEQLRVDLNGMHKKWKEEQVRRVAAEDNLKKSEDELQGWRTNSAKYKRKYEHEKIQNDGLRKKLKRYSLADAYPHLPRSEGQSDDSLEIESQRSEAEEFALEEEEDGAEETPPPSSSSLTTNSHTTKASSSRCKLEADLDAFNQPMPSSSSDSKSSTNSLRGREKTKSAETLDVIEVEHSREQPKKPRPPHGAKRPTSKANPSSRMSAGESHESTPGPDSRRKARDKEKHHSSSVAIDPELLDMCPDLVHDVEGLGSSKERTKEKKPRSLRSAKTAGVPTNPLAVRWSSQELRGRERKKQRLTMGVGDDE